MRHTPHDDIKHKHNETDDTATDTVVPWLSTVVTSCGHGGGCKRHSEECELEERVEDEVEHFFRFLEEFSRVTKELLYAEEEEEEGRCS